MDEVKKNPRGWQPGHPRFGGRKPGTPWSPKRTQQVRDIVAALEDELGRSVDPFEGLLRISVDENQPIDVRIDCMKACVGHMYPKLQATAHRAEVRVEAEVSTASITEMLQNPRLADAAQLLAFSLAESVQREEATSPAVIDLYNDHGIAVPRGPSESESLALAPASEDQENGQ